MIKYIDELKEEELSGKKILLRVDFDVPVVDGKISEDFRIKAHKETIDYLLGNGVKIMLVSHLGHEVSGASFFPIVEQLGEILGQTFTLVPHNERASADKLFGSCPMLLFDNTRQDEREVQNDNGFAGELAAGFDYYVNDDFATAHRSHASIVAVTKRLPSYAGFLIKKEIENLGQAIDAPPQGKILVLGGAKISTKLPVIKNFVDKAEKILIGGAIANNFFKANGLRIGASIVDETPADVKSDNIILPYDILVTDNKSGGSYFEPRPIQDIELEELIVDIGPQTARHYAEIIRGSQLVIWNGPVGLSEVEKFSKGTEVVARAVAESNNSIIGGGDTIAAVDKFGLLDKYSFVSTGGGSMLSFLAGERLAGLEALGYYD